MQEEGAEAIFQPADWQCTAPGWEEAELLTLPFR